MHLPTLARHQVRLRIGAALGAIVLATLALAACSGTGGSGTGGSGTPAPARPTIVVTHAVLGAVVTELVGDRATVVVLMHNGVDPHDWSPSAKDIEEVRRANLVVANGLGLEESLEKTLIEVAKMGVPVFRATDHIQVRIPAANDPANQGGAGDPHFWTDPIAVRDVVVALTTELGTVGVDVADQGTRLEAQLVNLDTEVRTTLDVVPPARRRLVTGHESMGYFADRYGFTLVGAVTPGLSSQGEVSAGELAKLEATIVREGVPAIFTEIGTSATVVTAIGTDLGVAVVQLPVHMLPADGSYFTFMREMATTVATALR